MVAERSSTALNAAYQQSDLVRHVLYFRLTSIGCEATKTAAEGASSILLLCAPVLQNWKLDPVVLYLPPCERELVFGNLQIE